MSTERPSAKKSVPCWRWVCMLLAFSFLDNPFMAAVASGGGLNVRHSASYRATVAATELQQLGPTGDEHSYLSGFFVAETGFALPEPPSEVLFICETELLAPPDSFSSNLWFRPPPAL